MMLLTFAWQDSCALQLDGLGQGVVEHVESRGRKIPWLEYHGETAGSMNLSYGCSNVENEIVYFEVDLQYMCCDELSKLFMSSHEM